METDYLEPNKGNNLIKICNNCGQGIEYNNHIFLEPYLCSSCKKLDKTINEITNKLDDNCKCIIL